MDYISVNQIAERWGISDRRVRALCAAGRIPGVIREGRAYLIPSDAVKPLDGRALRGMNIPAKLEPSFARIAEKRARLDSYRPLTAGELKRLQDEFTVEFTYSSNAIEGNTLTLKETALALEGITIDKKPLKDHLEAVGHRDAFFYIQELVTNNEPISEGIIKEIHSLVLIDRPEDKGVYRRIPVRIMGAVHEPPQPYLVPIQMEQLVQEFSNAKQHPIVSAALFHLKFEGIHPFIDGNGRTGRLVLNLTLMQNGYPPINVKFADRQRYYDCFGAYFENGTSLPMTEMIAEYVEEQLDEYLAILS